MFDEHVGDRAELYALGALDAREAQWVDAHAGQCEACARLVGAAESTVASLDAATVRRVSAPAALGVRLSRARRRPAIDWFRAGAMAAGVALVVSGALEARAIFHLRAVAAQDDAALAVIARSHFKHATLAKGRPDAPTAKVLWGTDRDWAYVVVGSATCACRIVIATGNGERDFGPPLARGATAVLFADGLKKVSRVDLRVHDATIESVATP